MKETDIQFFIEEMEEIGDIWTEEDVRRVYAEDTLQEAIASRKAELWWKAQNISIYLNYLDEKGNQQ